MACPILLNCSTCALIAATSVKVASPVTRTNDALASEAASPGFTVASLPISWSFASSAVNALSSKTRACATDVNSGGPSRDAPACDANECSL